MYDPPNTPAFEGDNNMANVFVRDDALNCLLTVDRGNHINYVSIQEMVWSANGGAIQAVLQNGISV